MASWMTQRPGHVTRIDQRMQSCERSALAGAGRRNVAKLMLRSSVDSP